MKRSINGKEIMNKTGHVIMEVTTNVIEKDQHGDVYHGLRFFLEVSGYYLWIVPVVFGIPGNIITVLVASRKHNKELSPCVYMEAMAVVDGLFLVGHTLFITIVIIYFPRLGEDIPHMREYFFK
jgi:uncharacterized YccA/Bax inhibitor family protein